MSLGRIPRTCIECVEDARNGHRDGHRVRPGDRPVRPGDAHGVRVHPEDVRGGRRDDHRVRPVPAIKASVSQPLQRASTSALEHICSLDGKDRALLRERT